MKIDGADIEPTKEMCIMLLELANQAHIAKVVDVEELIQSSSGPDLVELVNDGIVFAIHDTDSTETLKFHDTKFKCVHIVNHKLFDLAIALSPLEFYFMDNNYPEVLYYGDKTDFDLISNNGGYPQRWYGGIGPVGSFVTMSNGTKLQVVRL